MALTDDTPVSFLCSTDKAIFFKEACADWTEDDFARTSCQTIKFFKSGGKFLILQDGELQKSDHGDKFCIQYYCCSQRIKGRPVMFYINEGGRNKVVCCNENYEVHPVNMEIPKNIGEDSHKAIFYLIQKTNKEYIFESSLHKSYYLGFEHDSSKGYDKLILHHTDEVDEGTHIILENVTTVNAAVYP